AIDDGDIVAVPIWTTTPWTLPASVAVTLGPELSYSLVEGPARAGRRVLLVVASMLADACAARYGSPDANGAAKAFPKTVQGRELEGTELAHPFYTRTIPLILGDHVSAED